MRREDDVGVDVDVQLTSSSYTVADRTADIRYGTMHYIYVHPKADKASLICRTEPKKVMETTKTKHRYAQKKRSSHKAMESVLRPGRESMVGRICEIGRS